MNDVPSWAMLADRSNNTLTSSSSYTSGPGGRPAAPPGSSPWRRQIQLPSRLPAADMRDFIRDAKWRLLVMKERSGGGICASHVT